MLALRDVPGIDVVLADCQVGDFVLNRPVDQLRAIHFFALKTRVKLLVGEQQSRRKIDEVLQCVGKVTDIKRIGYFETRRRLMTSDRLRQGLELLDRPAASALLFGLEQRLSPFRVSALTRCKARDMRLTEYANMIVQRQPAHMHLATIFWRFDGNEPTPLTSLETEVMDAFGLSWSELAEAYERIVFIDVAIENNLWSNIVLPERRQRI